jgi:hypothetical protein
MTDASDEEIPLIFTRYLYSYVEVKQSLLIALLDKNPKEALFWAYECYYSGFTEHMFEYLIELYNEFYHEENQFLGMFINNETDAWRTNMSEDWRLGSIVCTLCSRPFQINGFVKDYCRVTCKPRIINRDNISNFIIRLNLESIIAYQTIEEDENGPSHILRNAYKYSIHKELNQLFQTTPKNHIDQYRNHWLYYASRSPIWADRIIEFEGEVDDEIRCIRFHDSEKEDAFYDIWNLEPDEQVLEIQEKSIGAKEPKQMSLMDFCKKYGEQPVIKIRRPIVKPILENTLVLAA